MKKIWTCQFDIKPKAMQSVTKGRDKNGKEVFYQTEERKAFKNTIALMCGCGKWEGPKHLIDYAVHARVYYFFEYPKNITQIALNGLKQHGLTFFPKTTRPDVTDNLNKGFIDAVAKAGIFKDDSYVTEIFASKHWAPKNMIAIDVFRIDVPKVLRPWCHGASSGPQQNNYEIGEK